MWHHSYTFVLCVEKNGDSGRQKTVWNSTTGIYDPAVKQSLIKNFRINLGQKCNNSFMNSTNKGLLL